MKYITVINYKKWNEESFSLCIVFDIDRGRREFFVDFFESHHQAFDFHQLSENEVLLTPRLAMAQFSEIKLLEIDVPASKIEYRLHITENDNTVVRRFSTRGNAIKWVESYFDEKDIEPSDYENDKGVWTYEDSDDNIGIILYAGIIEHIKDKDILKYADILGVDIGATKNEIKHAYRQKTKLHHPDMGGETEYFIKIQEAYDNLLNTESTKPQFTKIGVSIDRKALLDYAVNKKETSIKKEKAEIFTRIFDIAIVIGVFACFSPETLNIGILTTLIGLIGAGIFSGEQ